MAKRYGDIIKSVKVLVQDDAEIISGDEITLLFYKAIDFHNNKVPKKIIKDISGDGSYDYTLPDEYIDDFSVIHSVEFPAGERIPVYLEEDDWIIYKTESTTKLRFLNDTPSSTQTIRINISTQWTKSNISTMAENDVTAFEYLVASLYARTLSLYYAQNTDSTIEADSVDMSDLSNIYKDRASELITHYRKYFKIDKGSIAASIFLDWDLKSSHNDVRFVHSGVTF